MLLLGSHLCMLIPCPLLLGLNTCLLLAPLLLHHQPLLCAVAEIPLMPCLPSPRALLETAAGPRSLR